MRAIVVALLVAIPSSARAKLEIRGVEASHGSLGPARTSNEYVAGDQVFVRYTLAGVQTDEDGRTRCEMRMSVIGPKGRSGKPEPVAIQDLLPLGGDVLQGIATVDLDADSPSGEYELAVEFTDLLSKEKAAFRRKFTCKPAEFAMVRLRFYHDEAGTAPATAGGVVRQTLFVKFRAVGHDRGRDEIDLVMEMTVMNANGQPVGPKPIRIAFHNEKPDEVKRMNWVNFTGTMGLNRPGEFVLRITLTDTVSQKKVSFETPLRVAAP